VWAQPVVPCGGRVLRNGTPVNRVRAGRQQLSAGTPCAADRLAVAPSDGLRRAGADDGDGDRTVPIARSLVAAHR